MVFATREEVSTACLGDRSGEGHTTNKDCDFALNSALKISLPLKILCSASQQEKTSSRQSRVSSTGAKSIEQRSKNRRGGLGRRAETQKKAPLSAANILPGAKSKLDSQWMPPLGRRILDAPEIKSRQPPGDILHIIRDEKLSSSLMDGCDVGGKTEPSGGIIKNAAGLSRCRKCGSQMKRGCKTSHQPLWLLKIS